MAESSGLQVGIDIGGTFTDLCILDAHGIVAVGKTLTTHAEPAEGVEQVLLEALRTHQLDPAQITRVVHGTTLVTNALIERRGARTALITTRGFRDVLEMRREHRYELYDLDLQLPSPLVPRWARFEVDERTFADGQIDTPVDVEHLERLAVQLGSAGIEAVAVCFLHSHVNPHNEQVARQAIKNANPDLRVALSSEVNPEIREYERASTTVANVYVQQLVADYLDDLTDRVRRAGTGRAPLIMLSNGGLATVETARQFPIRMLESGPAGGALGAVAFGRRSGRDDQLAFDMGGTTAKACIIDLGEPLVSHTFEVDRVYRLKVGSGLPVRAPVIDMIEIGAGGGSIARVNPLGLLTIGPDSAGSEPGPVSYARGGADVTVTDADLVLGYLAPDGFLGGQMHLDHDAAERAIRTQIAEPLGIGVADAAWGIHATVNENMANAARVHAIERGKDPAGVPMFVMGGNGPVHGPGVAKLLGCQTVISPPAAGVLSAVGFLSARMAIDFARSWHVRMDGLDVEQAAKIFRELEDQGSEVMRSSGVPDTAITHTRRVDMRFVGQGTEIEVPVPPVTPTWHGEVRGAFEKCYVEQLGHVTPQGVDVEIVTWRLTSSGRDPEVALRQPSPEHATSASLGSRAAFFPGHGYVTTPVYDRYRLRPGGKVDGPALVQERESTLVLSPGALGRVSDDGSIEVHIPSTSKESSR